MIEDDGNYLPWDSLWDYLLGDDELDIIPVGDEEHRRISRQRNDDIMYDRRARLDSSPEQTRGRTRSKVRRRSRLREKDHQPAMRSVHSMASEKTSNRSSTMFDSRNDQSNATKSDTISSDWDARDEKMNERSADFEHSSKLIRPSNREMPRKNGEGGRHCLEIRSCDSSCETRHDKANLEETKNATDESKRSLTSKNVARSQKDDALTVDDGVQTVRLQHTTKNDLPFIDQKSLRVEQNGLKTKVLSSDILKSSFKGQSHGAESPARSKKGKDMGSTHTLAMDQPIHNDNETERMLGQSLNDHTSRSGVARRVGCWSNRDLTEFEQALSTEAGIPIYQLSRDDLVETFPKLLAVANNRVEVIGHPCEFQKSLPAHLQASFTIRGEPQSLYEYDYECEEHKFVTYKSFCSFPRSLLYVESGQIGRPPSAGTSDVLIQVEASTVSQTDCFIRQGKWRSRTSVPLPNTPGVDLIGKVCRIDRKSSQRYKLVAGDRVMSLVKWGGNSRYLQIDPAKAVKVPNKVDPVSTVCLAETYLSAYQILFHGILGTRRQRKGSLRGRTYMFFGSIDCNFASAIAEIAKYAEVKAIYASADRKRFQQYHKLGIVPFDQGHNDLTKTMKGMIDRVVSFDHEPSQLHFDMLNKEGDAIIVCGPEHMWKAHHGPPNLQPNLFCSKSRSQKYGKTYNYDVFKEWEEQVERCKTDLSFLIDLHAKGIISPCVRHRIPLHHVGKVHEMLETKQCSGFLVCEPWLVAKSKAICL